MSNLIVEITTIAISLIGVIISYILIPYIKSKTTEKQRDDIVFWIEIAVSAAEQIYKEKGQGRLKKEYVIEFMRGKGIELSINEFDVLIESTVLELKRMQGEW